MKTASKATLNRNIKQGTWTVIGSITKSGFVTVIDIIGTRQTIKVS